MTIDERLELMTEGADFIGLARNKNLGREFNFDAMITSINGKIHECSYSDQKRIKEKLTKVQAKANVAKMISNKSSVDKDGKIKNAKNTEGMLKSAKKELINFVSKYLNPALKKNGAEELDISKW